METIFSNCEGCNNLDALTEYENELLCERCLNEALDEDEQGEENWDDEDWFTNEDL